MYVLCVILFVIAARGIIGGRTVLEFPTIVALLAIAWVVPQGITITSMPSNPFASEDFWLYVSACFVALNFGFVAGRQGMQSSISRRKQHKVQDYSMKRALIAASVLTVLGLAADLQMRDIDTSGMESEWTGIITMWALVSKASAFGLCLAMLVYVRTRSPLALVVALVAAYPLFQAATLGVRREALFDLAILTAGTWYIARKKFPPRAAVIAAFCIGAIVLNTVGEIRSRVLNGDGSLWDSVTSEDFYRDFRLFNPEAANELAQAQYDYWYSNQIGELTFGATYYNSLVHQYVPAFLLGREFKESLKISTFDERLRRGEEDGLSFRGATRTGFSDSYQAFNILGALVFGVIGFWFGRLYAISLSGGLAGQYYYLVLMAEGLKSVTHSTGEFFASLPFTILLSFLALRYAEARRRRLISVGVSQL